MSHIEPLQVWLEGNFDIITLLQIRITTLFNDGIFGIGHVVTKDLFEIEPLFGVTTFDDKFGGEDVG
jgi:hypothetical protein